MTEERSSSRSNDFREWEQRTLGTVLADIYDKVIGRELNARGLVPVSNIFDIEAPAAPPRPLSGGDRRQHRLRSAPGSHTHTEWMDLVTLMGWKCFYCGRDLGPSTLTKDHVIPLAKGGSQNIENLVPACQPCNSSKGPR